MFACASISNNSLNFDTKAIIYYAQRWMAALAPTPGPMTLLASRACQVIGLLGLALLLI
jgi:hypothetical protein